MGEKLTKFVMYTGGLGPYMEVNGVMFPEKTVVEVKEDIMPAMKRRRKFIEVKGIKYMDKEITEIGTKK